MRCVLIILFLISIDHLITSLLVGNRGLSRAYHQLGLRPLVQVPDVVICTVLLCPRRRRIVCTFLAVSCSSRFELLRSFTKFFRHCRNHAIRFDD